MKSDISGLGVLVLGGGGFIGRNFVARLLALQADVCVVDVMNRDAAGVASHDRLEWRVGSIFDEALIERLARGRDAAVLLAANSLPATGNRDLSVEISQHVLASIRVAEICESAGMDAFVFPSSGGTVYGPGAGAPLKEDAPTRPLNAYGASKLAIEHYLRLLSGAGRMKTVSLRIANPYGPGQIAARGQGVVAAAFAHAFSGAPFPIWGDGSVVRDFIYVDDVSDALARALTYRGGASVMNIGTGAGCNLLQIIDMVQTVTGRRLHCEFTPGRKIDAPYNVLDVDMARRELNWTPATPIDKGITATGLWWEQTRART